MIRLHLLCNAHLDPYWQWDWQEGAAEALSTFRTAADLCEEFEEFVFNHNEVILYKWVEEYEPELFRRIQRLVKEGRWHIMGGWYLQPDCNMPSGESFVRQILTGRAYFQEKFGVTPTTAINFDPFGHNRGLVQILRKSGYDSYLFGRPGEGDIELPGDDFVWVGFDGSEVLAHRFWGWYNSPLGEAKAKVERFLKERKRRDIELMLWGVGNHGGGPSRKDVAELRELLASVTETEIVHSTPDAYFAEYKDIMAELPRLADEMNPWAVGCYTSMVRVKQKHRQLENELYKAEKMASAAAMQGRMAWPAGELDAALCDLMVAQFHDILPGSSIQPVEESALLLLDHGLETVSRVTARAFFALAEGEPRAAEGEIPILVHNPHPYPVRTPVECEFQLADQNLKGGYTISHVKQNGESVPCQNEQELGNLNLDWRKRAVFTAELAPSSINRFDCELELLPEKPRPKLQPKGGAISFKTPRVDAVVNCATGLLDKYAIDGFDFLEPEAMKLLMVRDNEDPWGMTVSEFREVLDCFKLMSPEESARFSGTRAATLDPVRVIEDGEVRSVVEAAFSCGNSFALVTYRLPKQGAELEVEVRVQWNEKDRMLKLALPTVFGEAKCLGQVAYGVQGFPTTGRENVAQKWVALCSENQNQALTCINDGVYGFDSANGELRYSLLRSPAYAAHPIGDRPILPQDRFRPRIDQGERIYRFWFNGGPTEERLAAIDREALVHNERPFAVSFFPSGLRDDRTQPMVRLSDDAVQMSALKQARDGNGFIVRLYEPTGRDRDVTIELPPLGISEEVAFSAFEVKTFRIDTAGKGLVETAMTEEDLQG